MTDTEKVDLSKYIEMRNDRPHIRGQKLPVMFIVAMKQENNASIGEIAYQFTITEEQVVAALLYYFEHKAEMDAQDAADLADDAEFFRIHSRKA
jgi:uncharacterized protein (DUF433 family)